jgi:hypothetical protein
MLEINSQMTIMASVIYRMILYFLDQLSHLQIQMHNKIRRGCLKMTTSSYFNLQTIT